jgi:tetratricopeptide (TPR) repeat protein
MAQIDTALLFAQGRCLMEQSEQDKAISFFEKIRIQDPEDSLAMDAAISLAQIFEEKQKISEARSLLEDVLDQAFDQSQIAQAHLRLGYIYLLEEKPQEAVVQFQLAQSVPGDELRQSVLNGLGDAEQMRRRLDEARRLYEDSRKISSVSSEGLYATYQLGRLELGEGNVNDAIGLFDSISYSDKSSIADDANLALAFIYLNQADLKKAREHISKVDASKKSPQSARAAYYLALVLLQEGNVPQSKISCEEIVKSYQGTEEALEARLLLADILATESSAREAFEGLLKDAYRIESFPPKLGARFARKLADLAHRSFDYKEAIRWYEVAGNSLAAYQGEIEYRIASCYEEAGDLEVAINRYRYIKDEPWRIKGQLAAAKLLEREERYLDAKRIYEEVSVAQVPESKIAQERLASLRIFIN